MSSTICRAKNPSTCQYHGSGASSNTRMLRDTMMVARSVYKAASDSEKLEAYYNLQDAEEAYYGTDEGRASLIEHINNSPESPQKRLWLQVLERADKKREFIETQMATLDKAPQTRKPSLLFNQKMKVEIVDSRSYVALANGSYKTGEEYSFEWDQSSGHVIYEEKGDIESGRILGIAKNINSAKLLCETWYEKMSANSVAG